MPQLDISTFYSQLFWLCVSFFTMLFIMSFLITPKIADILNQRQRKIDDYLDKAQETKEKALQSLDKYHQALEEATKNADIELEKAQKEMRDFVSKKQDEVNLAISKKVCDGEKKIKASQKEALDKVADISLELADVVVKKLALKIDKKEIQQVINSTLGE